MSKSKKSSKKSSKDSSSSSSSSSSKSKKHSKSKSKSKEVKHSSSNLKKIVACEKAVISLIKKHSKPHYTRRAIASRLKDEFDRGIVRAAVANLKSKEVIVFDHVKVKGKEKMDHLAKMLTRKAA